MPFLLCLHEVPIWASTHGATILSNGMKPFPIGRTKLSNEFIDISSCLGQDNGEGLPLELNYALTVGASTTRDGRKAGLIEGLNLTV